MMNNNFHFPRQNREEDYTAHIRESMYTVNLISMPIRALNEVVGVAMDAASIFAPFTVELIQIAAAGVYTACSNTSLAKSWSVYKKNKINELEKKYEISRDESEYFFHSVEEIGILGITLGLTKAYKCTKQGARNIVEQMKADANFQPPPCGPFIKKTIEFKDHVNGELELSMQRIGENLEKLEIKIKSLHALEKNSIDLPNYKSSTKTSGTLIRTLREIRKLAIEEGVSDVTLSWVIGNKKLLEIAQASKYLELVKKDVRQVTFKFKLPEKPALPKVMEFNDHVRGQLIYEMKKTGDKLEITLHGLRAFDKTSRDIAFSCSRINTPTSGTIFRALQEIKKLAIQEGAKDVEITWFGGNPRLLDVAKKATKHLEYLGDETGLGHQPRFKLKLPKIHSSAASTVVLALEEETFLSLGRRTALKKLVHEHSLISVAMQEPHESDRLEQVRKETNKLIDAAADRIDEISIKSRSRRAQNQKSTEEKEEVKEITPPEAYSTAVKVMQEAKEHLPQGMDVHVEIGSNIRNTTVNITQQVGDNVRAGANLTPGNWRQSTLTVGFETNRSENGTSAYCGVNFNPYQPKNSTINLSGSYKGGTVGLNFNPIKPKHSTLSCNYTSGNYGVSGFVNPTKPFSSKVFVSATVPVYGVPLSFGVGGRLNKPLDMALKVWLPLPGMRIQLLSFRLKSIENLPTKIKHNCQKVEDGFKKVFGGKTRKDKRRKAREREAAQMQLEIEAAAKMQRDWLQDYSKARVAVGQCYMTARVQCMIEEDLHPENYLADLFDDWKDAVDKNKFVGSFTDFILMIQQELKLENFNKVCAFSPTHKLSIKFLEKVEEHKKSILVRKESIQKLGGSIAEGDEKVIRMENLILSHGAALDDLADAMVKKREAKDEVFELIEEQKKQLEVLAHKKDLINSAEKKARLLTRLNEI